MLLRPSARYRIDSGTERRVKLLSKNQLSARSRILKLLSDGAWQLVETSCPVCDEFSGRIVSEIDRYGIPVTTVLCENCSTLRTSPQMRQQDYEHFYRDFYRPLYDGGTVADEQFVNEQFIRGRKLVQKCRQTIEISGKSVVEVGVGAGGVLQAFKEAGAIVSGCDFGTDFMETGKRAGLNLREGGIACLDDQSADVLVYSHVLEHVQNFGHEFAEIKRVMKPGGKLIIEVPGIYEIHKQYAGDLLEYLQNAHLVHFSKQSLTQLCEKFGFTPVFVDQHVYGVFQLSKEPNSALKFDKEPALIPYLLACSLMRHILKPLVLLVTRNRYRGVHE